MSHGRRNQSFSRHTLNLETCNPDLQARRLWILFKQPHTWLCSSASADMHHVARLLDDVV